MKRSQLFGLSTTAVALAVAAVGAVASPATAAATTCRTTMSGGLVGNEVIASSSDLYAEAAPASQRVTIDAVVVNYFGQKRYRLAAPIALVNTRGSSVTTFTGGTGYFVDAQDLAMTRKFTACSEALGI